MFATDDPSLAMAGGTGLLPPIVRPSGRPFGPLPTGLTQKVLFVGRLSADAGAVALGESLIDVAIWRIELR